MATSRNLDAGLLEYNLFHESRACTTRRHAPYDTSCLTHRLKSCRNDPHGTKTALKWQPSRVLLTFAKNGAFKCHQLS